MERIDFGSQDVKDFWLRFQDWYMSEELRSLMLSRFEPELKERFAGDVIPADGDRGHQRDDQLPRGRLLHRPASRHQGQDRHGDLLLAEPGAPENLGTKFYRPKDPAYNDVKHGDFDDFDQVSTRAVPAELGRVVPPHPEVLSRRRADLRGAERPV